MIATDGDANIEDLHPIFLRRLAAMFADPRARGLLFVRDGARFLQQQIDRWNVYLAGGPLAANPWKVLGERVMFGLRLIIEGGWHQIQKGSGKAYAADIGGYKALSASVWNDLVPWHSDYLAGKPAPYGLTRTVQPKNSPWEPWHVQPLGDVTTPYDSDPEEPLMALTDAEQADLLARTKRIDGELDAVLKNQAALTAAINTLAQSVADISTQVVGPDSVGVKLTAWQRKNLVDAIKAG